MSINPGFSKLARKELALHPQNLHDEVEQAWTGIEDF